MGKPWRFVVLPWVVDDLCGVKGRGGVNEK